MTERATTFGRLPTLDPHTSETTHYTTVVSPLHPHVSGFYRSMNGMNKERKAGYRTLGAGLGLAVFDIGLTATILPTTIGHLSRPLQFTEIGSDGLLALGSAFLVGKGLYHLLVKVRQHADTAVFIATTTRAVHIRHSRSGQRRVA